MFSIRQLTIPILILCVTCAPSIVKAQTGEEPFRATPFTEKTTTRPVTQKPTSISRRITPPSDGIKNRSSQSNPANKKKANGLGSIWTTLGSLALIIGLILLVAKLFKKNGGLTSGGLPREAIEVLGRQPIDARQSIHLIRLGARILVIGSSPDGMRTLTEIEDPVEVDYLAGVCQKSQDKTPFTNAFRTFFTQTDTNNQQPKQNQRHETSAVEVTPNQELVDQYEQRAPQTLNMRESSARRNVTHG